MMWHIRALAEDEEHEEMFSVNYRRLHWPIQLVSGLSSHRFPEETFSDDSLDELRPFSVVFRPLHPIASCLSLHIAS